MSYGDDFASVDTAGAPLDATIMIGADPMFWGAVLLALAVAAMIGWLIGGGSRSKRAGDAAGPIWDAIDDAAKGAMKADTESLPAHAAHLQRVLRARLGKTLKFGGELSRCADDLELALKGEAEHGDPHAGQDHAGQDDAAADHDDAASASSAGNVTIVSIHPGRPRPDRAPSKPGKRPMTTKERNDALRLAVADFNDYWRHRSARESDMRAVVAELCNPGPRRPRLSHSRDRH